MGASLRLPVCVPVPGGCLQRCGVYQPVPIRDRPCSLAPLAFGWQNAMRYDTWRVTTEESATARHRIGWLSAVGVRERDTLSRGASIEAGGNPLHDWTLADFHRLKDCGDKRQGMPAARVHGATFRLANCAAESIAGDTRGEPAASNSGDCLPRRGRSRSRLATQHLVSLAKPARKGAAVRARDCGFPRFRVARERLRTCIALDASASAHGHGPFAMRGPG